MGFECFLCLELNKEYANCIKIDSWKWNGQGIEGLIEKHLWPMHLFKSTSKWLCSPCWNILKDFHKLYKRVEECHLNYEITKSENTHEKDIINDMISEDQISEDQTSSTQSLVEIPPCDDNPQIEHSSHSSQDTLSSYGDLETELEDIYQVDLIEEDEIEEDEFDQFNDGAIIQYLPEDLFEPECENKETIYQIVDSPLPSPSNEVSLEALQLSKECNSSEKRQKMSKAYEHNQFLATHFQIACDICKAELESFPRLLKHFAEQHIGTKAYTICCGAKYFSRAALVDHIHSHLNPDYFKCKKCSKILKSHHSLLSHMARHDGKLYRCRVCYRKFLDKSKFEKHKLRHLSEEKPRRLPCPDCGKTYKHQSGLRQHQQRIHLNMTVKLCNICGASIRDHDTFKRHMAKHEGKPPPTSYVCDICGLVLSRKQCVRIHKELKHPQADNPVYSCDICSKYTTTCRSKLKDHIRLSHTAKRKHKCTICEKTYKDKKKLKEHLAFHTGEPIYTCSWCPKTFYSSGNLSSHRRRFHAKEWEETQSKKYAIKIPQNDKNLDA